MRRGGSTPISEETIACFLQIHVYHGRKGKGIVLAGAGDGSKSVIVEKVGGDMVSREVVGWGLNLGLQKATGSKCRLLAGALPGKCSIDVGELVALLKFMQEAINTFGQTMSETHIGILVYTIDSMGQADGCCGEKEKENRRDSPGVREANLIQPKWRAARWSVRG